MTFLIHFSASAGTAIGALLVGAAALHLLPRIDGPTRKLSNAACHAPGLDLIVSYFTAVPLIVFGTICGWAGILGAIVGQVIGVLIWIQIHEWQHRGLRQGPRIVTVINRLVGRWRNYTALWVTAFSVPVFCLIRMMEVFAYPLLVKLVRFPRYEQREWINVSRQKFSGLVGQDLIWCLYCDWMTGVWSLGSEMLRNVESFWCPIRFLDNKKCDNCSIDFPDIGQGWVDPHGTMQQVTDVVNRMHGNGFHGWFGHAVRITVNGIDIAPRAAPLEINAAASNIQGPSYPCAKR